MWVRSEHPYKPLSLSVPQSHSLSCASLKCSHLVCIWGCDPQNLYLHKHSEWLCLSPSIHIMQIASVNYCLFSAYPIALIGKADSQQDAPFSIAPFISCCDSGVISAKSSSQMFSHFSLVVFCFLCVWWVELILFGDNWYSARKNTNQCKDARAFEGTGRLSSRCPSAVKLALLLSSFNSWWCIYMWERADRWSTQLHRGVLGRNRSLSVDGLLRSARTWAWQRKYKPC